MWMNEAEIEYAASQRHECRNVRKGVNLLLRLMQAVNRQSDGWHSWPAPGKSAEGLMTLLQSKGNLQHGTHDTITDAELKKAVGPIKSMVTRQKKLQAKYGNKFDFDVQAALNEVN